MGFGEPPHFVVQAGDAGTAGRSVMVAGKSDAGRIEHRAKTHGGEEVDRHRCRAVGAGS